MFDHHVDAFWRQRESNRRLLSYAIVVALVAGMFGGVELLHRTTAWAVIAFTGSFALIVTSMLWRADLRPPRRRLPAGSHELESVAPRGETGSDASEEKSSGHR